MKRRSWVDIFKRQQIIIFIQNRSWDLFGDDFTKYTVIRTRALGHSNTVTKLTDLFRSRRFFRPNLRSLRRASSSKPAADADYTAPTSPWSETRGRHIHKSGLRYRQRRAHLWRPSRFRWLLRLSSSKSRHRLWRTIWRHKIDWDQHSYEFQ